VTFRPEYSECRRQILAEILAAGWYDVCTRRGTATGGISEAGAACNRMQRRATVGKIAGLKSRDEREMWEARIELLQLMRCEGRRTEVPNSRSRQCPFVEVVSR
jgi:hypothetical protein